MQQGGPAYLTVVQQDEDEHEHDYLIVPHGVDCDGRLIVEEHGTMADVKCNSCGAVVDTIPLERAGTRLMELASVEISSAICPRCGAIKALPSWPVRFGCSASKANRSMALDAPGMA